MNQRTALLISKASDPKTGWLDRQKLVELIVRECIAELESVKVNEYRTDVYDIGYDDGLTQAVETIKEHFGVEE